MQASLVQITHNSPTTVGLRQLEYAFPVSNLGSGGGGHDSRGHVVVTAERGWITTEWQITRVRMYEGTVGEGGMVGTDSELVFDNSQKIVDLGAVEVKELGLANAYYQL